MKKIKLLIGVVAMIGLVSSSIASADGFSPGEGLYIGGFGAVGLGLVQPKVTTVGNPAVTTHTERDPFTKSSVFANREHTGGTWEVKDGGLGLEGYEGGVWVGYGYKMGDFYAGLEGEYAPSDVTFKLEGTVVEMTDGKTISGVEATKENTGGAFGRVGVYLNADTLFSVRGGVLVSEFDVTTTGSTSFSETYYGGGPAVGASLTSRITAIDPNLSLRMGMVYTDYLTASVFSIGSNNGSMEATSGHDSEVTGSALSARVGFTYSFLDVNSLF